MTAAAYVGPNEIRSTGPSFDTWPANLPQVAYVVADGGFLCATCANGGDGSLAGLSDVTDRQWRIVGAQTNADDTACDHCGWMIPAGRI